MKFNYQAFTFQSNNRIAQEMIEITNIANKPKSNLTPADYLNLKEKIQHVNGVICGINIALQCIENEETYQKQINTILKAYENEIETVIDKVFD